MRDPEEAEVGTTVELDLNGAFMLSSSSTVDHCDSLHVVDVLKTQFQIPPHINLAPRGMLLSISAEYLLVEYFPLTGKFQFMWSGKLLLSNKPHANKSH